jgi:CDP-paratose 2-epimerase
MKVLVTGGAGFIGVNTCRHFLQKGCNVTALDNLSRKGTSRNIQNLKKDYKRLKFIKGDMSQPGHVIPLIGKNRFDLIIHLAGQVAVTRAIRYPQKDFMDNAFGSFNLLEAVRKYGKGDPCMIFSSTNKVYGNLRDRDVRLNRKKKRYEYMGVRGIHEDQRINFLSPYGCSKGTADQYFNDYARIYGLRTVVMRQSCIYGPHQFGLEDQGWLAWFVICFEFQKTISIFGDGCQVRDLLHVDDLVRCYEAAYLYRNKAAGEIYNIGGGARFSLSLLECIDLLEKIGGRKIKVRFDKWRPGDQKIFISDIKKAS